MLEGPRAPSSVASDMVTGERRVGANRFNLQFGLLAFMFVLTVVGLMAIGFLMPSLRVFACGVQLLHTGQLISCVTSLRSKRSSGEDQAKTVVLRCIAYTLAIIFWFTAW